MSGGGPSPEEAGPRRNVFGEDMPQSVELNLTALMDILSNLLFFLLASFGATIVMSINATVPVQSQDKSDVADNNQTVTVNLKVTKDTVEVAASSTGIPEEETNKLGKVVGRSGADFDYAAIASQLSRIKDAYPKSDTVIITPDPGVSYGVLITLMDSAREIPSAVAGKPPLKLFPTVVLSTVVK